MDDSSTRPERALLERLPIGVIWRDMTSHQLHMNAQAKALLRLDSSQEPNLKKALAAMTWQLEDRPLPAHLDPVLLGLNGRTQRPARYCLHRTDTDIYLDVSSYPHETVNGEPQVMVVVLTPISVAVGNGGSSGFDEVLAKVSARLINVDSDDIDGHIDAALAVLGEYCGTDRSYIFQFHNDGTCSNTHEWVRTGISRQKGNLQVLPESSLPWFFKTLRQHNIVAIDDVSSLPSDAVLERFEFEQEDIQSVLCIGLESAGQLLGFVGCDMVHRQQQWQTHDIRRFKLVGEMIASAIQNLAYRNSLNEIQSNLLQANKDLEKLAMQDGLTGVANRRAFDQTLQKELQRAVRQGYPLTLMLLDIDHFKLFNDHHGHLAGDDALKSVAQILADEFQRSGELVARYGGEEFAVILPHNDEIEGVASANRALNGLRALSIPHEHPDVNGPLTMSIGLLVALPKIQTKRDELIAMADQALYLAKAAGRNQMKKTILKGGVSDS
ncbi:diguanylate cyclase [Salinispirillum sp. LH 10-3-1]|uniref:diguanylate cyclase n=1 Tax=Salinispirillum sp. LH 10-3-1 TaxID=2952525 RepID=A0AB38YFD6_9GAMM